VTPLLTGRARRTPLCPLSVHESRVAELMAPYVALGVASVVRLERHAQQMWAYADAMERASALGGGFLGVVDADELVVPHGVGCLPELLARCQRTPRLQIIQPDGVSGIRRCAGLLLNRMTVRTCGGVGTAWLRGDGNASVLASTGFAIGALEPLVKSIVRLPYAADDATLSLQDLQWNTPHAPRLLGRTGVRWCMVGEDGNCTRFPMQTYERRPCSGDAAFVYHLEASSLLEWTLKKSVVGRIDQTSTNPCGSCFAPLSTIAAEFESICRASETCPHRFGPFCRGFPDCVPLRNFERALHEAPRRREGFGRAQLDSFLRDVDAEITSRIFNRAYESRVNAL